MVMPSPTAFLSGCPVRAREEFRMRQYWVIKFRKISLEPSAFVEVVSETQRLM